MNAKTRTLAWVLTVAALTATDRIVCHQPPPLRMLTLIIVLFLSMKAIVLLETSVRLTVPRLMAFVCGWFGMRPEVFTKRSTSPLAHGTRLVVTGVLSIAAGITAIEFAGHLTPIFRPVAVCFLFAGCSLILHFGVLNICAGMWRHLGFDCRALFRSPWQASTLAEFWGRRWNVAFSEMVSLAVVRPLTPSIGGRAARLAGFVASGLMHEVAITVPVHGGYGLPTVYFLIQAAMMDRELHQKTVGGLSRHALTLSTVLLPLPLVFPAAFVNYVVWPLTKLLG